MTEEDLKLYRQLIANRDAEISRLRKIVRTYCNPLRMSMANDPALQQTIDDAFAHGDVVKTDITPA